jgi:hypothetical protein
VKTASLLALGSCSVILGGCAVGYGVGYTRGSAGAVANPRSGFLADQPFTIATAYQEFRVIDTTGLVLAALVNSGRQYNARAEAIEQAQYKRPDQDGTVTVEYSYQPMPILSGLLTDLRIRLPLTTPTINGMEMPASVDYWGFDVRPEFYTFRPVKSLPMVASLWFNVEAERWNHTSSTLTDEYDLTEIDMGFGGSASYLVGESLTATGRVGIGVLSPLFALLSGGSVVNPSLEVEVGWRPWYSDKLGVMVSGVGYFGREFAVDRGVWNPRASLNVAFTFGTQIPKKRAPTPPPDAAPQAQALSGGVCAGTSQSPECLEVMKTAPDPVKILFAACAQATVNAANANRFDTQPGVCRTAGRGITKYVADNGATLDEPTRRIALVAAAGAFDFAGAGYELAGAKLGPDHCAMVEATFNAVVGPDSANPVLGAKVQLVNAAVTECRAKYTCTAADGDMTCVAK